MFITNSKLILSNKSSKSIFYLYLQMELLKLLSDVRKTIADEFEVSAHHVCSNKILASLSKTRSVHKRKHLKKAINVTLIP